MTPIPDTARTCSPTPEQQAVQEIRRQIEAAPAPIRELTEGLATHMRALVRTYGDAGLMAWALASAEMAAAGEI